MEAARTEEPSPHESAIPRVHPPIGVVRCARCRRVLSGRVRPSERGPERRRRRPRLPKDLVALRQAAGWIAATKFQGDRILTLLAAQTALPPDPRMWTDEQRRKHNEANDLGEWRIVEYYEGFFFLCAVAQARRWLPRTTKKATPETRAAIAEFQRVTDQATDVRDMIVHEDEYLFGRGSNAAKYRIAFKGTLDVSAHSLVARGDDYLLGGRVSVPNTTESARILLPLLDEAARRRTAEVEREAASERARG